MMTNDIFSALEKDYYIYMKDVENLIYKINLTDFLFIEEKRKECIDFYGDKIKSLDNKVQAAYFAGYFGSFCAGIQYLINHGIIIDFSISNIDIQLYEDHKYDSVEICFTLKDATMKAVPVDEDKWVKEVLEDFYRQTVMPLLEIWNVSTGITMDHLLKLISLRLHYDHEQEVEKAKTIEEKNNVEKNFNLLIKEIDPKVFKNQYNPFDITFEMIESPKNPNIMLKMKKACCLYYLTEGATCKCYTCPEMTEEERLIRKREILKKSIQ